MASRFLLLLLPALSLARIDIEVSGRYENSHEPNMRIQYSGNEVGVISDEERDNFKLGDSNLKWMVDSYFGKRPTDAYLRSPTPWGDLYQSYGWDQILRSLAPVDGRILSITSEPMIIKRQIFHNNSSKPAIVNVGISQTVANTVVSKWYGNAEMTSGQEINYDWEMEPLKAGGKTSFSYTSSYGKDTEKAITVTIGPESEMDLLLQPNQSVVAELQATKATVRLEMAYEVRLDGQVAVNYDKKYKGHHFWALDVIGVMSSAGLPNRVRSTEVVEVGFYTNAQIIVRDEESSVMMMQAAM